MSKSYDGFIGPADTPYVLSVSSSANLEVRYCETPEILLTTVREYEADVTADQIVRLLMCWAGDGVTIGGHEFSIEREN